jgi:hypothetical protein
VNPGVYSTDLSVEYTPGWTLMHQETHSFGRAYGRLWREARHGHFRAPGRA